MTIYIRAGLQQERYLKRRFVEQITHRSTMSLALVLALSMAVTRCAVSQACVSSIAKYTALQRRQATRKTMEKEGVCMSK